MLQAVGIDCVHVGDVGYAMATDAAVLALADQQGRLVVTLDADFHRLLAQSGATSPSVIRIRIEGLRAVALASLLQDVLAQSAGDLAQGAVVTVQERRLRIRRLPLI